MTALATFFATLSIIGVLTLFFNTLGVGALSAVRDFGFLLVVVAIMILAYIAFRFLQYMQQVFDKAIQNQKQEQLMLLEKLNNEILETQTKLNYYRNELNQITNLQKKVDIILQDILKDSYDCIAAKQKLIEALRERKSKDIANALMKKTISEKGALKAQRKFNELLYRIEDIISREKYFFDLFASNLNETIKQLQKQISEVKNE